MPTERERTGATRRGTMLLVVVTALVAAGIAVAVLYARAGAFGTRGWILFGLLIFMGALTIAAVRSSGSGTVGPAQCEACGGLVSPSSPYCKHCGEPPTG